MKTKRRYPQYPDSAWDYSVVESARQALQKPNKVICIYCHGQAISEEALKKKHNHDCPAKEE